MSNWKKSSPELIEAFYSALQNKASIEMRKMFGYPCAFIRGNMCTGLHQESWILRLSEEDREEIKSEYGAKSFEPIKGRVMREYVAISEKIKKDQQLLAKWIEKSIVYTSSLPIKLPKKRKLKATSKK